MNINLNIQITQCAGVAIESLLSSLINKSIYSESSIQSEMWIKNSQWRDNWFIHILKVLWEYNYFKLPDILVTVWSSSFTELVWYHTVVFRT